MPPQLPMHVVAVFSRERATADFLKRALDSAGYISFTAPSELTRLEPFLEAIHPDAVVVDMTLATEATWEELMRLRNGPGWSDRMAMVLTTADATGLRQWLTGPASAEQPAVVEMFTHAADLKELRGAVAAAVKRSRVRAATSRLAS